MSNPIDPLDEVLATDAKLEAIAALRANPSFMGAIQSAARAGLAELEAAGHVVLAEGEAAAAKMAPILLDAAGKILADSLTSIVSGLVAKRLGR